MISGFLLVQTIYWLALCIWLGGQLFVAIAAPIIHRTVRDSRPILPDVLSVNLENEHGSLLAGCIVGNILRVLSTVQLWCAGVILLTLVGQWLLMAYTRENIIHGIIRSSLFVGAIVLAAYDRWIVWPKAWRFRQEYIDHADEPEIANPAKDEFDRYHRESMRVMFIVLGLLSLMVVFSSTVRPATF
jgi:hypothetical protein